MIWRECHRPFMWSVCIAKLALLTVALWAASCATSGPTLSHPPACLVFSSQGWNPLLRDGLPRHVWHPVWELQEVHHRESPGGITALDCLFHSSLVHNMVKTSELTRFSWSPDSPSGWPVLERRLHQGANSTTNPHLWTDAAVIWHATTTELGFQERARFHRCSIPFFMITLRFCCGGYKKILLTLWPQHVINCGKGKQPCVGLCASCCACLWADN